VDAQAGSDQAGKDFGATVTHVSGDNDVKKQVQLVENFIAKKVDAIILQAVDTQGVISVIKEANDARIAVFTPGESPAGGKVVTTANDEMALGALRAITEANRQKEIVLVGTDGIGDARTAIAAGHLAATYALPPFLQGYMVTETAIKYLQGVKVCGKIEERGL